MAEDDDATYRRRLREILLRHGFGWVVQQAEAQIADGKPSSKEVSERETTPVSADPMFAIRRPRSRRASLITSEPYTESERLEILLQAIEAAIVRRSLIEQDLLERLHDASTIRFEPDSAVETGEEYFGASHVLDSNRRTTAVELESQAQEALGRMRTRNHGSA